MLQLSHERRLARRIAARWATRLAMGDWQPPIPAEAQAFFHKFAFDPNTEDGLALSDAQDSVGVFLPKILEMLHKKQGDRYGVNASESRGKIFYFFAPRQPVDAFSLTLYIQQGRAVVHFGYIPYKIDGTLDLRNMKSERSASNPAMAGLAVMRLVRNVLSDL